MGRMILGEPKTDKNTILKFKKKKCVQDYWDYQIDIWRQSEERGVYQLLCLLLHATIHLLVWCLTVAINRWGICKVMHEADHNNSSVNEWNRSAQANQQGGLALRTYKYVFFLKWFFTQTVYTRCTRMNCEIVPVNSFTRFVQYGASGKGIVEI